MSKDGETAIAGDPSGRVRVWSISSGRLLAECVHGSGVMRKGSIFISEGQVFREVDVPVSKYTSVASSPDGSYALSGCFADKSMIIWDVEDAKKICQYDLPSEVARVHFLPDGTRALTACWDGSMYEWNLPLPRKWA